MQVLLNVQCTLCISIFDVHVHVYTCTCMCTCVRACAIEAILVHVIFHVYVNVQ